MFRCGRCVKSWYMTQPTHIHRSDLRALLHLVSHAANEGVELVEAVHGQNGTRGLTRAIYSSIGTVTRQVGGLVDDVLRLFLPADRDRPSSYQREVGLSILNGVVGDHLARTGSTMAIPMQFRLGGRALRLESGALAQDVPHAGGKILVMVHGLCMSDLQWKHQGHDHGETLAHDRGYTPVYLRYNSGLNISTNGRAFAQLLDTLVAQWPRPVTELSIIAHSMGGLVSRSACYCGDLGGHAWRRYPGKLFMLGTPHHGTVLERGGNGLEILVGRLPYVSPLARLGRIRSAGITDLRYGNVLDEDWQGHEAYAPTRDTRKPVPLPAGIESYALAATLGESDSDMKGCLLGDGLVSTGSALGHHRDPRYCLSFPRSRQWVGQGLGHMDLLSHPDVCEQLRLWC